MTSVCNACSQIKANAIELWSNDKRNLAWKGAKAMVAAALVGAAILYAGASYPVTLTIAGVVGIAAFCYYLYHKNTTTDTRQSISLLEASGSHYRTNSRANSATESTEGNALPESKDGKTADAAEKEPEARTPTPLPAGPEDVRAVLALTPAGNSEATAKEQAA